MSWQPRSNTDSCGKRMQRIIVRRRRVDVFGDTRSATRPSCSSLDALLDLGGGGSGGGGS
jgi:hypothetical protein